MHGRDSNNEAHLSRGNRTAAGVLAAVLLAVAIVAVWYGLAVLASAAKEILVSVVAAVASLLSAVFAYAFQRAKDMELAAIQKRRELEASERKIKQENYTRILERLAPYVRDPMKASDDFATAYLHSWVVGSPVVVWSVNEFLVTRSASSLDQMLHAMRNDLTLESHDRSLLWNLTSRGLFPVPPPPPPFQGLKE